MKGSRLHSIIRSMFMLAAVWAVIASLFIFFTFGGMRATAPATEGGSGAETIEQISWFESQGWWGIAILFIFAVLFYGPLHFYKRNQIIWTVTFGVVAITISILSGFSIGTVYWLGSLALLIGLVLMPLARKE